MDRPVSEELRSLLNRQELRGTTAGTVKPHMMKWANDLLDKEEMVDTDHSPSDGRGTRRNEVARARVRVIRERPFLAVIDGGTR
jgi:hypothetical protein